MLESRDNRSMRVFTTLTFTDDDLQTLLLGLKEHERVLSEQAKWFEEVVRLFSNFVDSRAEHWHASTKLQLEETQQMIRRIKSAG